MVLRESFSYEVSFNNQYCISFENKSCQACSLLYELHEYIPSLYLFYSLVRIPIDQGPILFYWLVELERYAILLLVQNFVLCYCYPKCLVVPLLNAVPVKIFYDLLKGSRVSKSCISLRLVSYGNAMI